MTITTKRNETCQICKSKIKWTDTPQGIGFGVCGCSPCLVKGCKEKTYALDKQLCFDHFNEYESEDLVD